MHSYPFDRTEGGYPIGRIVLSELLTSLPPPDLLSEILLMLPNTTLAIRHNEAAILVGPYAELIGGKLYQIAYYGYTLDIAIVKWQFVIDHKKTIVIALPGRATLALLT